MSDLTEKWGNSTRPSYPEGFDPFPCSFLQSYIAYPQLDRDTLPEEASCLKTALNYVNDVHNVSLCESLPNAVHIQLKGTRSLDLVRFLLPPGWGLDEFSKVLGPRHPAPSLNT